MKLLWTIILSSIVLSNGFDRTKLWNIPQPMKGFNLQGFLGRWFVVFRSSSDSWAGTREFRDYEIFCTIEKEGVMTYHRTVRQNGICNTIVGEAKIKKPPGTFSTHDLLGSNLGGYGVLVATDYKTFAISYGCVRRTMYGQKCEDGSLNIRTRTPYPDPSIIKRINKILISLYGTTVDQLQKVIHDQPCNRQPFVCQNGKWW